MERRDEDLILKVASGEISCLAMLYEKYKNPIITYAFYTLGNMQEAEDVLQEAFIRVFRHAKRFRPEKAKFSTWLYSIAANLCRDKLRKKIRRRAAITALPLDRILSEAAARTSSPRKKASGKEFLSGLWKEMRTLAAEQREVIVLHYMGGKKYSEIAEILGCPVGTVQSRLHAGLKILRGKLKDFLA